LLKSFYYIQKKKEKVTLPCIYTVILV